MLKWTDFYGGDLADTEAIKKGKTKKELKAILDRHQSFMEDMLSDAGSHLDSFKDKLGLRML